MCRTNLYSPCVARFRFIGRTLQRRSRRWYKYSRSKSFNFCKLVKGISKKISQTESTDKQVTQTRTWKKVEHFIWPHAQHMSWQSGWPACAAEINSFSHAFACSYVFTHRLFCPKLSNKNNAHKIGRLVGQLEYEGTLRLMRTLMITNLEYA